MPVPATSPGDARLFDLSVIIQNFPLFWSGLLVTLFYSAISIAAGLVIGLVIGLIQLTGSRVLTIIGRVYVEIFRNIPLLVILLWIYYAFPIFAGLSVTKFWAGFAGLSLYAGAFGFTDAPYFKADEGAKAAPKVQF